MIEDTKLQQICRDFARLGTTIIADAMGKTGGVPHVKPIEGNLQSVAGPIYYAEAYNDSNWPTHESLRQVPGSYFIFVEGLNVSDRAIFGSLVTTYLWKKCGVVGIAVNGNLRDMQSLIAMHAPVWCTGASPIGCFNKYVPSPSDEERRLFDNAARRFYSDPRGGIAVADASGVVIVPHEQIDLVHARALEIELLEVRWFRALEEGKNTFEIVCLGQH
jgi:4-hydroxy-4-methyl-2-oxoglutarate aldolase